MDLHDPDLDPVDLRGGGAVGVSPELCADRKRGSRVDDETVRVVGALGDEGGRIDVVLVARKPLAVLCPLRSRKIDGEKKFSAFVVATVGTRACAARAETWPACGVNVVVPERGSPVVVFVLTDPRVLAAAEPVTSALAPAITPAAISAACTVPSLIFGLVTASLARSEAFHARGAMSLLCTSFLPRPKAA